MSKKTIIFFFILEFLGLVVLFAFYKLSKTQITQVSEIETIKKDFLDGAKKAVKQVLDEDVNKCIEELYFMQTNQLKKIEKKQEEEKKFSIPKEYLITICDSVYYLYSNISNTAYTIGDYCPFEPQKKIEIITPDYIILDDKTCYLAYSKPTLEERTFQNVKENLDDR